MAYSMNDDYVHPQAHIKDSHIGKRTRVWQFATVIRGAWLGDDCSVAAYAIVDGSQVGDRCIISHAAFIDPGIEIGNDVFVGPFVALCNDAFPRADKIDFDMAALASGAFVTTRILDGASIGAASVVLPGLLIGRNAMIAAGSVVTKDVPDDHLWKRDGSTARLDGRAVKRMRLAPEAF